MATVLVQEGTIKLGDTVVVETTPADFGRVAAQTARQVIQQRIREAERSNQMQYFERQVGEIVSGSKATQQVPALKAGSYFFRCDVHHEMTGTITAK